MKYQIDYNSQRDNFTFKNKFKSFWQCFSTSAWKLISYYTDYDATDDEMLAIYLDDVEASVGKPGIGEKIRQKYKWITKETSYWWLVQQAGLEKWLWRQGIKGSAIYCDIKGADRQATFDEIEYFLDEFSPVILQTKKMGGLKGGHIILAVGYDSENIICHDPFGNALTKYTDHDGKYVLYPKDFLIKYTGNKIRCIYWAN